MSQNPQSVLVLSVVIPVYNECDTWRQVVARVAAVELPGLARQIVLVDDCSRDGTRGQLEEFSRHCPALPADVQAGQVGYKVLFHPVNRGKGAAVRTGFQAAEGHWVIVQDADLEYDPNDYPRLLAPALEGAAEVVFGSRFRDGHPKGYLKNYLANRFLTALSNLTTGLGLTDMETCYKLFRRDVLGRIVLEQERFGFEPEITAKVAGLGAAVREVPISYAARTHRQGKKIGWKDGLKAIWCILKYAPVARRRGKAVKPPA